MAIPMIKLPEAALTDIIEKDFEKELIRIKEDKLNKSINDTMTKYKHRKRDIEDNKGVIESFFGIDLGMGI